MNSKFKPYRLINGTELSYLQQAFACKLQHWNDVHALFPLSCQLRRNPKLLRSTQFHHVTNDANCSFALLDKSCLSFIKYSLFDDPSACFDAVTETLFMALLSQLLGTRVQMLGQGPTYICEDWFYTGAPTLALALTCVNETITIYLHPQWVSDALPSNYRSKKSPATLHEALATQRLQLHVGLNPLPLKLADIIRLQVGDVIKTDHPITDPLKLTHQQQTICNVDIGKSNTTKSILTTRKS